MKRNFSLTSERHKPARVLDAIKHDIRKYLKRERKRALPEEMDYWDFDCRVGGTETEAEAVHVADIIKAVDATVGAAKDPEGSIYVEILAKATKRAHRTTPDQT